MKHSVREYVKRLPTEELEKFLRQCTQETRLEDYAYIIPYIEKVLDQRRQQNSERDCKE